MKKQLISKLYRLILISSLFFIGTLQSVAYADAGQQIQLSFIYNFARFVTWPQTNPAAPLMICVLGSQPLADSISLLQNKKVDMHVIQVRSLNANPKIADCSMLFISESESALLTEIFSPLANQPILTVSTIGEFVQSGGMIGMKEVDNRLRFDINLAVARKAGLTISSQLLQLADEVIK